MPIPRFCLAALGLIIAAPATAQDGRATATAGIYALDAAPDDDPSVVVEVRGTGDVVSYDNADLRSTDESSIPAIINSDDRSTFGQTDVDVSVLFRASDAVEIDATLDTHATWGESSGGSSVGLGAASVLLRPISTGSFELGIRAGRQRFSIGGADRDYFLSGVVDGFTIDAEVVDVFTLRLLPFDLFHPNEVPEDRGNAIRPDARRANQLRGETNTYRTGAILQTVDQLADGLDLRLFFFHAGVGGGTPESGTGADISEGGLLGNFRDRDYVQLLGFRGGYGAEFSSGVFFDTVAEFARSQGIDRKEATSVDVETSGNALGLGLGFGYQTDSLRAALVADWHRMDGAKYSVNGLEYQRGFTSMRGSRIGGLASGRIAGMRPSASLDRFGVLHNPEDVDRNAGTDFLHIALEFSCENTDLTLGFWTYKDTRESGFDQSTLDEIQPPPEHSREEFSAQRRTGLALGNELDVEYRQRIDGFGALFAQAGLFMPGEYYSHDVSNIVTPNAIDGNQRLGGQESFWAIAVGAEFGLGYRSAQ
jgi:hypothetical protein